MFRLTLLITLILIPLTTPGQTIINSYAAVLSFGGCNQIVVDNAAGFNTGDDVLIIQMKGAVIDSTNTAAFGTLINPGNCGSYEINKIQAITGTAISLTYNLARTYSIPGGKVQLIKVPRYNNYTISTRHSCTPWNGVKGGIFAIIVNNTLTLNDTIDVSGRGFRGGVNANPIYHVQYIRNQTDYSFPVNNLTGGMKGEGIAEVSPARLYCRGELYNGGGGGNSTNAGGGGGANGGTGGRGGDEWVGAPPTSVGGRGGRVFIYDPTTNRITMGGGGGAGDVNDAYTANGGNGGGIVLLFAGSISGTGGGILANGQNGLDCQSFGAGCNDGFGGGGAGGTILINTQNITQLSVSATGGRGANIRTNTGHGPGGGGGGGAILVNNSALFSSISYNHSGGAGGTATIGATTTSWGTQPGTAGDTTSGFIIPIASVPANAGLNAVISDSLSGCQELTLKATGNQPIVTVNWNFGDGATGSGNPGTHRYSAPGTYTIVAIVSSAAGCLDTVSKTLAVPGELIDEQLTDSLINCHSFMLEATSLGAKIKKYTWLTGQGTPLSGNPVIVSYSAPGNYSLMLIAEDSLGCIDSFTSTISVSPGFEYGIKDSIISCTDVICDTLNYGNNYAAKITWLMGNADSFSISPVAYNYDRTGAYNIRLIISDTSGCADTFSKTVYLENIPIPLTTTNDTTICYASTITLEVKGAYTYEWFPKSGLNQGHGASVTAMPVAPVTYKVTGIDTNGCKGYDSVFIGILPYPDIKILSDGDRVTCDKPELVLVSTGGIRYAWGPADLIEDTTSVVQTVVPKLTTKYYVYGYDTNGCWQVASIVVKVEKDPAIFMPNAFTPNNDGLNEKIRPHELCNFTMTQFSVFNRWGEEVYTTKNITSGWNGTYKGKKQPVGTYFYMIKGQGADGKPALFKGDITLIR